MPRPVPSAAAPFGASFSLDRRALGFALSAAIHAAALAVLLLWHFGPATSLVPSALTVVDLADDPPPEPDKPPPPQPQASQGAAKPREAGAPAPKAEAAPLAAAIPVAIPTLPSAPVPATGTATSSGAAAAGSGTGAGGTGSGSGGGGDGDGSGGGKLRLSKEPEIVRGSFRRSDYPKELRALGPSGTTWADIVVGVDGRVTSCRVTRPSGIPQFDAKTCQILLQRFRYRPARDVQGKPVAAPDSFSVDWDYVDLDDE